MNSITVMDDLRLIACLLPVVFMIHDFEEIIFAKYWIDRNQNYLKERFPKVAAKLLPRVESLSVSGFSFAVAEEFVLLSIVTYVSVYLDTYYLWFAAFMGFSIHLLVHVVQWIMLRRYVPAIVTSLVSLAYSVYAFIVVLDTNVFQFSEMVMCTVIGILVMVVNILFAHKLGHMLDKRMSRGTQL